MSGGEMCGKTGACILLCGILYFGQIRFAKAHYDKGVNTLRYRESMTAEERAAWQKAVKDNVAAEKHDFKFETAVPWLEEAMK